MQTYIKKLLSYKYENSEKKNINKSSPSECLNSCNSFLENESSFLNKLQKYTIQKKDTMENDKKGEDGEEQNQMGD